MNFDFSRMAESVESQVLTWRRHLHRNPELSYQEYNTSQYIYDTLQSFGGLAVSRPLRTGVVARLQGGRPGRTVAIRADIDALPIQEENELEFASQNPGVMHACGHDTHAAMLLGTAKLFSSVKDEIPGEIRFIFQHAEEKFPPGGAQELVDAGVMEGVDYVLGAHVWSPLPAGKVGLRCGALLASPDTFLITVKGKGGHGAMPHQTVDPITTGAEVVVNLQHIVSRSVDPLANVVVTVGRFSGGTADNIIPGTVQIEGTFRTLDPVLREKVPEWLERIVKGVTEAHGAGYELTVTKGYHPVINDEGVVRTLEETVAEILGREAVEFVQPSMGAEDFSAYLQKAPGAFFLLGGGNAEKGYIYPHHHSRMMVDEGVLVNGIKIFLQATFKLLTAARRAE